MSFRKIHSSFWSDPDLEEWLPDQKYFYLYCITNDRQTACGVMLFSIKRISFDLGWNHDTVYAAVRDLTAKGKIMLDEETKELYVTSFYKYNQAKTQKHKQHLFDKVSTIKSETLKAQVIADIEAAGQEVTIEDKPASLPKFTHKETNIPFDKLWSIWERPYDEKGKAEREWRKLSEEDRKMAMEFIPSYMKNREPQYRSYLHRLLKGKPWVDAKLPVAPNQSPKIDKLTTDDLSKLW